MSHRSQQAHLPIVPTATRFAGLSCLLWYLSLSSRSFSRSLSAVSLAAPPCLALSLPSPPSRCWASYGAEQADLPAPSPSRRYRISMKRHGIASLRKGTSPPLSEKTRHRIFMTTRPFYEKAWDCLLMRRHVFMERQDRQLSCSDQLSPTSPIAHCQLPKTRPSGHNLAKPKCASGVAFDVLLLHHRL